MNITACILTFNLIANRREDLFWETHHSLSEAGVTVIPVDNGSGDGTHKIVEDLGGFVWQGWNTTSGHGTNLCARVALGTNPDLCVLSDDDMVWHPGWHETLAAWWAEAPDDLVLTGCHLEPFFPWNGPYAKVTYGGTTGLMRASTGAASWSFRPADWPKIGPVPQQIQGHGDVPACQNVWANGGRIAQIDLATHIGQGKSTWGNRTDAMYGWDVDPVRELIAQGETVR